MKTLFFNSINGDRRYNAIDFTSYFSRILSNGVFLNGDNNFQVVASTEMKIKIKKGAGNILGSFFSEDSDTEITLPTSTSQNNIIVIIRLDYLTRETYITTKETQDIFDLQRDNEAYEICLALISIPPNTITMLQSFITDTRPINEVCGFVNSLITVDSEDLFIQFENNFEEWFKDIKNQLDEDVAGNLLNLINSNKDEIKSMKDSYNSPNGIAVLNNEGKLETDKIELPAFNVLATAESTLDLEVNNIDMSKGSSTKTINIYGDINSYAPIFIYINSVQIGKYTPQSTNYTSIQLQIKLNSLGNVFYRHKTKTENFSLYSKFKDVTPGINNIRITCSKIIDVEILEG